MGAISCHGGHLPVKSPALVETMSNLRRYFVWFDLFPWILGLYRGWYKEAQLDLLLALHDTSVKRQIIASSVLSVHV